MKKYLSFGGGVNSTALLLLLTDLGEEFETIFVNHGGDYPETYEYINYLRDEGFSITEIIPESDGCHTILEYCFKHKIIPTRRWRWCTVRFKIRPILKYVDTPCEIMLGITSDENKHRLVKSRNKQIKNTFPLYEHKITRSECIKIIKDHGLNVPPKSGCFFCPFMSRVEARMLYLYHYDLYQIVLDLERNCRKSNYYLKESVPFDEYAQAHTPPITCWLD